MAHVIEMPLGWAMQNPMWLVRMRLTGGHFRGRTAKDPKWTGANQGLEPIVCIPISEAEVEPLRTTFRDDPVRFVEV